MEHDFFVYRRNWKWVKYMESRIECHLMYRFFFLSVPLLLPFLLFRILALYIFLLIVHQWWPKEANTNTHQNRWDQLKGKLKWDGIEYSQKSMTYCVTRSFILTTRREPFLLVIIDNCRIIVLICKITLIKIDKFMVCFIRNNFSGELSNCN